MAWRPAYSLQTLKAQLDTAYPGWTFLGFIGDQAHASVPSDHNPNAQGVVTALDIGPGGKLNIHALADKLAAKPHPDLKYIISNRRIAEWQNGFKWRAYSGSDPHDTHIHVSVGRGPDGQSRQPYDDRVKWNLEGDDMYKGRFENKTVNLSAHQWYDKAVHYRKRTQEEVAKNESLTKQLAALKSQVGDTTEATLLGKALLPIIQKLGYKK